MKTIQSITLTSSELNALYARIYPKLYITYPPGWEERGHCLEYAGAWNDGKGYKKVKFKGVSYYVHRIIWTYQNGTIDNFMILDHVCRNPACCRPDHLEAVSVKENTLRGRGKWIFEQGYTAK